MKFDKCLITVGVVAAAALRVVAAEPAPLAGIPIHCMEFHIWWNTPFFGPEDQRVWRKWNWTPGAEINRAVGPSWRRDTGSASYPLIGPYNSADPEVIRWQLRCAKAAGIAALQVMLFPNQHHGYTEGREAVFAKVVEVAGQENEPVYLHDEINFTKAPGQTPEAFATRVATILNRYGRQPGYFKVNGRPAFCFQYFGNWATPEQIVAAVKMMNDSVPGGIYGIINAEPNPLYHGAAGIGAVITNSNSNFIHPDSDRAESRELAGLQPKIEAFRRARPIFSGQKLALKAYAGFDDAQRQTGQDHWFPRGANLANFRQVLTAYAAQKPDFIAITSWNDWDENTALEPALEVDGFNGDPYQALRTIAALQGKTFTPPPLPPFASMDPWITALHHGPDQTPPRLAEVWLEPNQSAVRFSLIDETSPIGRLEVARAAECSLSWPGGKMDAVGMQPPMDATAAQEKRKRFGRDLAQDFSVTIPAEKFAKKETAWLAVTVWDGQKDVLKIDYPVNPPTRLEPTDEFTLSRYLVFPLDGTQQWVTRIFPLDDFDPAANRGAIKFRAVKSTPDSPNLLGAVSLFVEKNLETADVIELSATADRETVTALAQRVPWDPQIIRHYLVTGRDKNGNRMLPLALDPGNQPTSAMLRVPLPD